MMSDEQTAQSLLESLTPGGSEFYKNPQRCHEWVERQQTETLRIAVKASAECNDLRTRLAAAEKRLAEYDAITSIASLRDERDEAREQLAAADALADWVGWWLSARREEEATKLTEMRKRLDAYRALAPAAVAEGKADE